MIECINCGKRYSNELPRCPICGNANNHQSVIECNNCGKCYPDKLPRCPICGNANNHQSSSQDDFRFTEYTILETTGYAVCSFLSSNQSDIIIPSQYNNKPVLAIKDSAFLYNRVLLKVHIPDSIQRIGDYAFDGCTALTTVSGCSHLRYVGNYAFRGCIELDDQCELFSANFACSKNSFAGCYRLPILFEHE